MGVGGDAAGVDILLSSAVEGLNRYALLFLCPLVPNIYCAGGEDAGVVANDPAVGSGIDAAAIADAEGLKRAATIDEEAMEEEEGEGEGTV